MAPPTKEPYLWKDASPTLARSGTLAARALIRSGPEGAQGVFNSKGGVPFLYVPFCLFTFVIYLQ